MIIATPKGFTLHDMPANERPRERLQKFGADALSAQELLALILGRGVRGDSVMSTAQKLLARFGSLTGIVEASLEELQSVRGLGLAKAAQLKACLEIARRVEKHDNDSEKKRNRRQSVAEPADIARAIRKKIRNFNKEHYFLISFDVRNRIIDADVIAVGTLNASLVHPRETFEIAIQRHATSIAIAHNHPSGDPNPSEADVAVTKRLSEAGLIMGIQLLDHIVISKTKLFSFRENGLFK